MSDDSDVLIFEEDSPSPPSRSFVSKTLLTALPSLAASSTSTRPELKTVLQSNCCTSNDYESISTHKINGNSKKSASVHSSTICGCGEESFQETMQNSTKIRLHSPTSDCHGRSRLIPAADMTNIPIVDLADPNVELEENDSNDASKVIFDEELKATTDPVLTGFEEIVKEPQHVNGVESNSQTSNPIDGPTDSSCICGEPNAGFMIACDLCNKWYHGECINVDMQKARSLTNYYCPKCTSREKPSVILVDRLVDNNCQGTSGTHTKQVSRFDEFTEVSQVFAEGMNSRLSSQFRSAIVKQLQLTSEYPDNIREYDFSSCVPRAFRNDETISTAITKAVSKYVGAYQNDQRVVNFIKDAVPVIKPLLEKGVNLSRKKLLSVFGQIMNKLPPEKRRPGLKSVVDRASKSFLERVCGLTEGRSEPSTSDIPVSSARNLSNLEEDCRKSDELCTPDATTPSRPSKHRPAVDDRLSVCTRKMKLADERRRSVTSSEGLRIEDFRTFDEVYECKANGILTRKYLKTAMECLRINANYPNSFTEIDLDAAIPSFVLEHHQAASVLRQRLLESAKAYQLNEKAQAIYRGSASELLEMLNSSEAISENKLRQFFGRVVKEKSLVVNPPTINFLLRNATLTNLKKAIRESGIDVSSFPERVKRFAKPLKLEADCMVSSPEKNKNMTDFVTAENEGIFEKSSDKNSQKSITGNHSTEELPYQVSFEASEPRSIFDGTMVKAEVDDDFADFCMRELPIAGPSDVSLKDQAEKATEEDNLEFSFLSHPDFGSRVLPMEEYTQLGQVFSIIMRNGVGRRSLTKKFRQTAITLLGVTAEYPSSFSDFDISPVIPSFVAENIRFKFCKKVVDALRDHQKAERARKVITIALKELGIEHGNVKDVPEETLNSVLQTVIQAQHWDSNLPSLMYTRQRALLLGNDRCCSNSNGKSQVCDEVCGTGVSFEDANVQHSRRITNESGDDVIFFEEHGRSGVDGPIATFTSFDQIYKSPFEKVFNYDYRRAAMAVLGITVDYPEDFQDFDFSPAIPPFVKENSDEFYFLKRKLSLAAKQLQRHLRSHAIIMLAAPALKEEMERNHDLEPDKLRSIFEKLLVSAKWGSNIPGISFVLDRARPSVIARAIRLVTKNESSGFNCVGTRFGSHHMQKSETYVSKWTDMKDINEYKKAEEMFKNGTAGQLTDNYRRSALVALKVDIDYPSNYTDFDYGVAIPQFYLKSASSSDLMDLRDRLRRAAASHQISLRGKLILKSAAPSILRLNIADENAKNEAIKKILEKKIEEKQWKCHSPCVKKLMNTITPNCTFGFSNMKDVYEGGKNTNPLTEEFLALSFVKLNITTDYPVDFASIDLMAAVPLFMARNEDESALLKQKLLVVAAEHQRSLRAKQVIDWATPQISSAKKKGVELKEADLKKMFFQTIKAHQRVSWNREADYMVTFFLENSFNVHDCLGRHRGQSTSSLLLSHDSKTQLSDSSQLVQKRKRQASSEIHSASFDCATSSVNVNSDGPENKKRRYSCFTDGSSIAPEKRRSPASLPSKQGSDEKSDKDSSGWVEQVMQGLDQVPEEERLEMMSYLRKEVNRKLASKILEITSGLSAEEQNELIRKTVFDRSYKRL